jgi:hypothetical protein
MGFVGGVVSYARTQVTFKESNWQLDSNIHKQIRT